MSFGAQGQNLVAHFAFTSCWLGDSSPNGMGLTTSGSPVCTTGRAGLASTAYYFNGSTDWFTTSYTSPLFNLNKWTISAVVKFRAFNTNPTNCQVSKILSSNDWQSGAEHFSLETNDNNVDNSCTVASGNQQFFGMSAYTPPSFNGYGTGPILSTNTWYCLTATYDNTTGNVDAYIDGTWWYTRTWGTTPNYNSPDPLVYIGKGLGGGTTTYYFDGIIDDVQIWDDVLTPTAIGQMCTDVQDPPCWANTVTFTGYQSMPFYYEFKASNAYSPYTSSPCIEWTYFEPGNPVRQTGGTYPSSQAWTPTFTAGGGVYTICAEVVDCTTGNPCSNSRPYCFDMCMDNTSGAKTGNTGLNESKGNGSIAEAKVSKSNKKTTAGCTLTDIQFDGSGDSVGHYHFQPHPPLGTGECVAWTFIPALPGTTNPIVSPTLLVNFPKNPGPGTQPFNPSSYNICAEIVDCNPPHAACGSQQICFDMCLSTYSGAKSALNVSTAKAKFDHGVGTPYPNPASNLLTVPVQNLNGAVTMTITGVDGKVFLTQEVTASTKSTQLQIRTDMLAPGIYILSVTSNEGKVSKPFSKL